MMGRVVHLAPALSDAERNIQTTGLSEALPNLVEEIGQHPLGPQTGLDEVAARPPSPKVSRTSPAAKTIPAAMSPIE